MTRRHRPLTEVLGEPREKPSLAQAIGPARLVSLAQELGPREPESAGRQSPVRAARSAPPR